MKGINWEDFADPGNILFWLLLPVTFPFVLLYWLVEWIG
jgi:hypothetical protein